MEFEAERYLLRDLERVFQRLHPRHHTCSCVRLESLSGGCQGHAVILTFFFGQLRLNGGQKGTEVLYV